MGTLPREGKLISMIERGRALFTNFPFRAVALILILFMLLRWLLMKVALLPEESYFGPLIVLEIVKAAPRLTWRLLPLLVLAAVLAWRWREVIAPWSSWEHGGLVRVLMGVAAILIAWPAATYDYNLYFDRWHAVDRIVVAFLAAGVWWRPVFVWPFLGVSLAVVAQFDQPIGNYPWPAVDLPLYILLLLCAFQLTSLGTKKCSAAPLLYLACCMVAIHYFPSGLAKLRNGWLWQDHIEFLLPSTYANGWWGGASAEAIGKFTAMIEKWNPLLRFITLGLECGMIFFLLNRRLAMLLLPLLVVLHGGIFLVSGIFFWQWMIIDLCLVVLFWKGPVFRTTEVFSLGGCIVAIVIIGSARWWLGPVALSWADSRATYSYRMEVTVESGARYLLPPRFLSPYDQQFTFGRFSKLSKEPMLPITWGATSRKVATRLLKATTAEEVLEIEAELAQVFYDEQTSERLAEFLPRFLDDFHEHESRRRRLHWIAAPRGLWTLQEPREYDFTEPIVSLQVNQVLTFYDGTTVQTIRVRPVLSVEVPHEDL